MLNDIVVDAQLYPIVLSFFRSWEVDALILEFWWALGQPAYATLAFSDAKGRIKQLADLVCCQIFNLNRIAQIGAKRIDRGAKAKLYKLTDGIGADRAMSFRPGINVRGKSFGHCDSTDCIGAVASRGVRIFFARVCHV